MKSIDPKLVTQTAKELYIRALKVLPPDVKAALARAHERESHPRAREILGVMLRNLEVAESRGLLVCQDTGTPVYKLWIGRGLEYDGPQLMAAIVDGVKQATVEHPLRSSVCHPIDRTNPQTNTGERIPAIEVEFWPWMPAAVTSTPTCSVRPSAVSPTFMPSWGSRDDQPNGSCLGTPALSSGYPPRRARRGAPSPRHPLGLVRA